MEEFSHALECFTEAVAAPAACVSAVVQSSLKKCCILSLLVHGTRYSPPKYASPAVVRTLEELPPAYISLAGLFADDKLGDLRRQLQDNEAELRQNQDFGIASQLPDALLRQRVLRTLNAFSSLSVAKLQARLELSSDEAELYLVKALADADKAGLMVRVDGIAKVIYVSAKPAPERALSTLLAETEALQALDGRVRALHARLLASKKYLKSQAKLASSPFP